MVRINNRQADKQNGTFDGNTGQLPGSDIRQVMQLLVFIQRQPENRQKLLQQLIDQQRAHGYHISAAVTARVGVVKDVNDKKLIGASLMQAFPDADIKDLFQKTAIQSFRLPDGNEGKCCIVYDFPSGKPADHNDADDANNAPIMAFNDVMLIITEACNFRCSYCYENGNSYSAGNKMSLETAKKAVDILFSQTPANMKRTCLNFFGGEPALEFDLIKKVVEYSYGHRTIGGYKGNKYNYVINTNGAILTDEMFEFYSRLGKKFNIRVSVDGYGDNHDRTRKLADGRGTWRLLEKTLPRFRDLKETYGVRVNLISTINKSTFRDIYYNYTHLYESTGMQIAFLFVHEEKWDEEDYKTIKEQVMLLYDYSLQYKIRFPLSSVQTQQESANLNGGGLFQKICNAGIRSFTVNHGGDMFSCHRAYYYGLDDVFKMGNTETGFIAPIRSLMYRINNLKRLPQKCQDCNPGLRNKCHICMASNKKAYGDFYRAPDGYCTLMKELYDEIPARERQRRQSD